jgi:hypothetical protein
MSGISTSHVHCFSCLCLSMLSELPFVHALDLSKVLSYAEFSVPLLLLLRGQDNLEAAVILWNTTHFMFAGQEAL